MADLAARVAATERVVARFRNKPFDWRAAATCVHLARAQMRALGHRPPTIPPFRSAPGALRALRAAGFADVAAMLDSLLPRIAPAAMWPGDLAVIEGEPPFDAIVIGAGGKVLGWHGSMLDRGLVPIVDAPIKAAWRL